MNRKNSQTYEVLTRVVDLGTRNVSLFPENSAIAELLETLESGRKTLAEQDAIRASADTKVRVGRTTEVLLSDCGAASVYVLVLTRTR